MEASLVDAFASLGLDSDVAEFAWSLASDEDQPREDRLEGLLDIIDGETVSRGTLPSLHPCSYTLTVA
jgi:hypothetical protein